jgi:hypothetical protein
MSPQTPREILRIRGSHLVPSTLGVISSITLFPQSGKPERVESVWIAVNQLIPMGCIHRKRHQCPNRKDDPIREGKILNNLSDHNVLIQEEECQRYGRSRLTQSVLAANECNLCDSLMKLSTLTIRSMAVFVHPYCFTTDSTSSLNSGTYSVLTARSYNA